MLFLLVRGSLQSWQAVASAACLDSLLTSLPVAAGLNLFPLFCEASSRDSIPCPLPCILPCHNGGRTAE